MFCLTISTSSPQSQQIHKKDTAKVIQVNKAQTTLLKQKSSKLDSLFIQLNADTTNKAKKKK